jgi:hypothetical protein
MHYKVHKKLVLVKHRLLIMNSRDCSRFAEGESRSVFVNKDVASIDHAALEFCTFSV